ncbi:methyltransferase [Nonomuraea sp. 3-1Str]|uniref:methyltransferase n=1 Tax=Nonomuraea sp. 3-1Str TaxID=2929801 RepID=UPI0028584F09|nr:methyltransferase [Nonomuraea sp. 3-1Str]MDR8413108.1 methyltransferase [Nonomuraea sp. 3-1Str]
MSDARAPRDVQADNAFITMLNLTDTVAPWAIRAAATLRLADLVTPDGASADSILKGLEVAGESVDPEAVRRLLRYLAHLGVFDHDEPSEVYRPTRLSALMSEDNPVSMRDWWDMGGAMTRLDQTPVHMIDAVRTGGPVYERIFGQDVWADLAEHPHLAASFEKAMAHKTRISLDSVITAIDWSARGDVVDVGGGHGLLLEAVLRASPDARGIVFDTPAGVATARAHLAGSPVADRAGFVEGDFFAAWPTGADTYVLMNVLHNWSDDQAVAVLRRGAEALGSTGRLLVIETVVGGGGDQRSLARLDIMMLLFCGGKERSRPQYDELAARAGLTVAESYPTSFGLEILELRPAGSR